jgi:hypothetical protein
MAEDPPETPNYGFPIMSEATDDYVDLWQLIIEDGSDQTNNDGLIVPLDTILNSIESDVSTNASNLSDHESATNVHGSNGDVAGMNDLHDPVSGGGNISVDTSQTVSVSPQGSGSNLDADTVDGQHASDITYPSETNPASQSTGYIESSESNPDWWNGNESDGTKKLTSLNSTEVHYYRDEDLDLLGPVDGYYLSFDLDYNAILERVGYVPEKGGNVNWVYASSTGSSGENTSHSWSDAFPEDTVYQWAFEVKNTSDQYEYGIVLNEMWPHNVSLPEHSHTLP